MTHSVLGTEGRQWGRQIAFRDGSDLANDPPTWPQAGDHVKLVIAEHAFVDNFGNRSETYSYADLIWPDKDGILVDTTAPRIEEICSQGSELKLTFSEPVSAELAAQALTIDSQPVAWIAANDGYTLKFNLEAGSHDLVLDQEALDLAGLALAEYSNQVFVTDTTTRPIYAAKFPGEAAASTVGNVYGFQGLPEDFETGFLYVRNRYYDPELGRFITTDPMEYADGPSPYQFALNNPVSNGDPTGESATLLVGGVGGLAGASYAGYRSLRYGEDFNWHYVIQGAAAGAAVGFGVDTLGAGSGVSAAVIGGAFLGAGLGGAAESVASGGSYASFGRGAVKGGILGGIGGATSAAITIRGLQASEALWWSTGADTLVGAGVDAAFGDCHSVHDCLEENFIYSWAGNSFGHAVSKRMGLTRKLETDGYFDYLMERVKSSDFSTPENGAIFGPSLSWVTRRRPKNGRLITECLLLR